LDCGCKGSTFSVTSNYPQQLFFFFFLSTPHSPRFSSSNRFKSQPVAQPAHGFSFFSERRKKE
ncbi:MAG: hypothetical protein IKS70_02265, partial [Bacteroides sp.]|nr:hypothetical protein [Bacteroides sp.]